MDMKSVLGNLIRRLRSLLQRPKVRSEIDEELQFHLDMKAESNRKQGMPPDQADRSARKRFGNFQRVREQCRDIRGAGLGETSVQDARFALRQLRKNRGETSVVLGTLSLLVGAMTLCLGMYQ